MWYAEKLQKFNFVKIYTITLGLPKFIMEKVWTCLKKISKQIILSSTLCAYFFRKILKFSTIILDSFRTVWFEAIYFSPYLFEVRARRFWLFSFKILYFSNGLSGNTITFPMLSMQIRYCSNVLESKSHSSNFCPKLHTAQMVSEKKENRYFSNIWDRAMMFFGGFGQNQMPFDYFGKSIDSFRMFWIELRNVSNVFGTNSKFFAVCIYNYNLLRMVFTKCNTFRIRPISDDFL